MRPMFDEQLALLHKELIAMGSMCENAIALSVKALDDGDAELARSAPEYSAEIDRKEREIEALCMRLLLREQPVARDLRTVSAALKMVTDMERIGDNSGDIAEIVSKGHLRAAREKPDIGVIARATMKMVTDSIDAFVRNDVELARSVIASDDVVDGYFSRVKAALIETLRGRGDDGERALDLLMVAKYLERMGDHAAGIAGWVVYAITGKIARDERAERVRNVSPET